MKDKIQGEGDIVKGKIKEEAGKLSGDKSTELGGKMDLAKGHVEKGVGDLKQDVKR